MQMKTKNAVLAERVVQLEMIMTMYKMPIPPHLFDDTDDVSDESEAE